jgi:hypothetical protein
MPRRNTNLTPKENLEALRWVLEVADYAPPDAVIPAFAPKMENIRTRADHDKQFLNWFESLRDYPHLELTSRATILTIDPTSA